MAAPYSPANSRKTHCPAGHAYQGDNIIVANNDYGNGKKRICRECRKEINKRYRLRKKMVPDPVSPEEAHQHGH